MTYRLYVHCFHNIFIGLYISPALSSNVSIRLYLLMCFCRNRCDSVAKQREPGVPLSKLCSYLKHWCLVIVNILLKYFCMGMEEGSGSSNSNGPWIIIWRLWRYFIYTNSLIYTACVASVCYVLCKSMLCKLQLIVSKHRKCQCHTVIYKIEWPVVYQVLPKLKQSAFSQGFIDVHKWSDGV